MLLAIDIGNTHTVLGIFQKKKLIAHWRVSSPVLRTEDEIFLLVKNLCDNSKISTAKINAVGISSVVPNLTDVYERMAKKYFHKEPLLISASLNLGIKIHYDDPLAVGADRLCNAVAAFAKYKSACIVIDFGTATTYDVIANNGDYLGGVITAGLETIASELHRRAAKLPKVELHFPKSAIGKNTVTSMQSGIMFGAVDSLEGMIRRLKKEIGNAKVIATGGLASLVSSQTKTIDAIESWLVLEGIRLIVERREN
jgi:type III pantothenate kinase